MLTSKSDKENLGELFEVELGDQGRAAAAFEEAASWYESVRNLISGAR
jgi:hypothetical protein